MLGGDVLQLHVNVIIIRGGASPLLPLVGLPGGSATHLLSSSPKHFKESTPSFAALGSRPDPILSLGRSSYPPLLEAILPI